jgi:hypothetical protein
MTTAARRLDEIEFDNLFVRSLPADPSDVMRSRQVRNVSYTFTPPTPVTAPELLAWSDVLGAQLGLSRPSRIDAAVEALAGNRILTGMQPYSARYGGHQFGNWAGQLGDGRAITLGEMIDSAGSDRNCSSRVPARRPTRAVPTAARCCARRCANSCAARRCSTSASRPRAR